ncbi:XRCC4-like factor-domain-containing protein [Truncatella angustata]|uniref:Non-homologous end-joining factor 1 n=1 Tax=Truncatella angustata TaxID=152316 RepID=A0A9P8US67_9PEZI|nr:XRCC4-like factor-domain-containing protein [Truncatella angustata]KAH6657060.1 XRCC4-like factor-domain-containing protein [Truncatella angustata]
MNTMSWKPLPAFDGLPVLLASAVFSSQSYTIHVTDLANVWTETLDRKNIGRRSLNEDTSIDPTEGPDQMAMLLTKIRAAVDPNAPDYDQTSITLASKPGTDGSSLVLSVTCHLPDGLKPLKWTFQLVKCSVASIASELVLPLVEAQHIRSREIQDLVTKLKEKDHVIHKLLDKLEHAGVGLDNVFSSLAGNRRPSRETAYEIIKGLAPFNESDWSSKELPMKDPPGDIVSLVENAFPGPKHQYTGTNIPDGLSDWWQRLGPDPITAVHRVQKGKGAASPKGIQRDGLAEKSRLAANEDDDFQVQATPSQLDSGRKGYTEIGADATTDDEADTIPDSHHSTTRQAKQRLGIVGKRKTAEPDAASRIYQRTTVAGDDTASELDDETDVSLPHRRKDGGQGSFGKTSSPARSGSRSSLSGSLVILPDDDTASESDEDMPGKAPSPTPLADMQAPKRKLGAIGRIGGKAKHTTDQPESESKLLDEVQGSQTDGTNRESGEAESEEQRAERKRAEIAQDLERKAAAKPVKKKRKF